MLSFDVYKWRKHIPAHAVLTKWVSELFIFFFILHNASHSLSLVCCSAIWNFASAMLFPQYTIFFSSLSHSPSVSRRRCLLFKWEVRFLLFYFVHSSFTHISLSLSLFFRESFSFQLNSIFHVLFCVTLLTTSLSHST